MHQKIKVVGYYPTTKINSLNILNLIFFQITVSLIIPLPAAGQAKLNKHQYG